MNFLLSNQDTEPIFASISGFDGASIGSILGFENDRSQPEVEFSSLSESWIVLHTLDSISVVIISSMSSFFGNCSDNNALNLIKTLPVDLLRRFEEIFFIPVIVTTAVLINAFRSIQMGSRQVLFIPEIREAEFQIIQKNLGENIHFLSKHQATHNFQSNRSKILN